MRMVERTRQRPLIVRLESPLNGRNGRKAEQLLLRSSAILHGVVWPIAVCPLWSKAAGKADDLLPI